MGAFGVVMVEQIKMEGYSLLLLLVKRRQGRSGIISPKSYYRGLIQDLTGLRLPVGL